MSQVHEMMHALIFDDGDGGLPKRALLEFYELTLVKIHISGRAKISQLNGGKIQTNHS